MKRIETAVVICFALGFAFVALQELKRKTAPQSLEQDQHMAETAKGDGAAATDDAITQSFDESPPSKVESRAPVAVVNGKAITAAELKEELDKLLISSSTHAKMEPRKKEGLRKIALEELIVRELAYQKAKAMGLKVDKKEFKAAIKKIKDRYKTEKDFQEALKIEEITRQEFEQRIEKNLLLQKVRQTEIEDKAQVSDGKAKQHYEENKSQFLLPESVHLKNIVIKVEPGKEGEAKKRIDEIYEKLKAGADFYEMAYKFSEDDYRVLGGDYGPVHRGQIVPELEAAAFEAIPGDVTFPFKTSYGWHIIKAENKQPERQMSFEEVKEKIKEGLYQKRLTERRQEFVSSLKCAAQIQYVSK